MITGELRSKINSIWEIFRTGGLTNPLDVIEQEIAKGLEELEALLHE